MDFSQEQLRAMGHVLAALPFVVQALRWVAAKLGRPIQGEGAIRAVAAVSALALAAAWSALSLPALPAWSGLDFDFAAAVLGWLGALVGLVTGYVATAHLIYEYLLRKLFDRIPPLASKNLS